MSQIPTALMVTTIQMYYLTVAVDQELRHGSSAHGLTQVKSMENVGCALLIFRLD